MLALRGIDLEIMASEFVAVMGPSGITIIMVTHESEMAAYAGRRIHFVDGEIDNR